MNRQEADVLNALAERPFSSQRDLAAGAGHSLGAVNRALKSLTAGGYLDDVMQPTAKAREAFSAHRPENAVILAAGRGMRMAPINMTTSKALLEVKGERLIERLIRQLREAGVGRIAVVVGFMKERFEYLIDDFDVELLVSEDYESRNNLHSLRLAGDMLQNAYIVPCDIWCGKNPFRRRELYSWYMVRDEADRVSEVRVNRRMELVRVAPEEEGNAMVGIAYLTGEVSGRVRERMEALAADRRYDGAFWEQALYDGDRMIAQARMVGRGAVVEINTYEQLRELDSGSDQLKTDAIDAIEAVFHCENGDITGIEQVKKGMTNRSFSFVVAGRRYIMRVPGEGTDKLIDRQREAAVYRCIAGRGICDDPVWLEPDRGYKIVRFTENARSCDVDNVDDLRLCMEKLRQFHSLALTVPHTFDLFGQMEFYETLWQGRPSIYRDYAGTKANVLSLRPFVERHRGPMCLTHIDAVPDNFLIAPGEGGVSVQLIDWEYAGMQDKHVDIAMFSIYSLYDRARIDRLIDIYFEPEGGCGSVTRAKIYCYVAICGLLWSNWCEYKRLIGVEFGAYSLRQYRYAKEYFRLADAMIKELDGEEEKA